MKREYIGYVLPGWGDFFQRDMNTSYGCVFIPDIYCIKRKATGHIKRVKITMEDI